MRRQRTRVSPVPIPPEVLFHRYLQEHCSNEVRTHYWGKYDLSGSELNDFQRLLLNLQIALNEALMQADSKVPHHIDCPAFHVDYIDADVENAIAFRHEDYSFIGLTELLMYKLWCVCKAVSEAGAPAFRPVLRMPFEAENLRRVLFRTLLFFIVTHEYTHHVHGHVLERDAQSVFFEEMKTRAANGNFEVQVCELDADGYATYLVLDSLISGDSRELALQLLKMRRNPSTSRTKCCSPVSCWPLEAFSSPALPLRWTAQPSIRSTIYTLNHPPQAARMNCVMQQARGWCGKNRPGLGDWMSLERFNILMDIVVQATWGMNGGRDWADQTAFLQSEDGTGYFDRLHIGLTAHIESIRLRA